MLFYKVLILFWGVLEHALMLGGSKIALFFTLFTLLQYLSPRPDTNDSISSGFDEDPPPKKWNVLWLVSCPSALWLAHSLDRVSVLPHPYPLGLILKRAELPLYLPLEWTCNFVDSFMPKHAHYTLTNIQKGKKHNRTSLNCVPKTNKAFTGFTSEKWQNYHFGEEYPFNLLINLFFVIKKLICIIIIIFYFIAICLWICTYCTYISIYIFKILILIQCRLNASFMNIYEYKCKQRSCSSKKKCFSRQSAMRAGSGNQVHQPKPSFLFLTSQSSPSISLGKPWHGAIPFPPTLLLFYAVLRWPLELCSPPPTAGKICSFSWSRSCTLQSCWQISISGRSDDVDSSSHLQRKPLAWCLAGNLFKMLQILYNRKMQTYTILQKVLGGSPPFNEQVWLL